MLKMNANVNINKLDASPKSRESLFCCQNCDNVVLPSGKLSVTDLHPTHNSAEMHYEKSGSITHRTYKGAKPVCLNEAEM